MNMGLPVTIYKSTDAGAPVTTITKPSDWITVLKKCLVEGYGTKAPLGWTLEFENTSTYAAVFRNDPLVGSGGYLQVNSSTGSNGTDVDIDLHVAKAMSGINSFTDKILMRRLDVYSSRTSGWVVIGTSRGFWMIQPSSEITASTSVGYSSGCWSVFVGDMESFDANDMSPFTLVHGVAGTGDGTVIGYQNNIGSTTGIHAIMRTPDGSAGVYNYYFNLNGTEIRTSADVNPSGVPFAAPMHLSAVVPPFNGVYTNNTSEAVPVVRGSIPGLYFSSLVGGRSLTQFYHVFGDDTYRIIQGYWTPAFWIKTTGEWYV
jgi:hypothetical protein